MARPFLSLVPIFAAACFSVGMSPAARASSAPNIVYILADDLGYGDVQACNPEGKIPTPNLNGIAREGIFFSDAHSNSAVCTPTRYGILTGRYAWRSRLKKGVLGGYSDHLIERGRPTVASFLKRVGYHTAIIGKWHLGMDWERLPEAPKEEPKGFRPIPVDYAKGVTNGPNMVGFQYAFGISASLDMPPYIYIENGKTVGLPTVEKSFKVPKRPGPAHEDFEAKFVLRDIAEKASAYIRERGHDPERKPFFLYLPLNSPHTPIVPREPFQGKSGVGEYGDFVVETDWAVGKVLEALEDNGFDENTLIMFTSDNGCTPRADFEALGALGHDPNAGLRGHKADIYEGGHRVPFLARWPGRIPPGSQSDQTVCLTDLFATVAEIVGADLPAEAAPDSVSLLPIFEGKATTPVREATVHHSVNGSFALRQGKWKLCFCPGSGGWSFPRPGRDSMEGRPPLQLFDLESDPAEKVNLTIQEPERVREMTALMQRIIDRGRSTPGPDLTNEGDTPFLREG